MNETTIKDKIIEVLTHATLYMRQKGHTHHQGKDAAKYIVAEAIKKISILLTDNLQNISQKMK